MITGAVIAGLVFGALLLVGFVVKVVFWLVFLPLRIVFKLLFGIGGLLVGAIAAPLLLLVLGLGLVLAVLAALAALILPLLPVLMLLAVGWAIYRGAVRPASPVG